ncbi:MAG TPA: gliding motility protein GldM [Porphyromonadaceae bacterium]|nr:gliding motility protein GldM [Porphyromonadaceae bacterium]
MMLSNSQKNGKELREKLMEFTKLAEEMLPKNEFSGKLLENFFTSLSKRKKGTNANWQESLFENMPAIASVIILSKLQSSALYVEGEVLHQLLSSSNDGTIGVSMFKPYLLPTSKNVIAGGKYSAQVVLASIDTTHSYDIYIDGKLLDKNNHGWYEKVTSKPGHYTLKGEVSILNTKGEKLVYPFEETYDVVEPMATVSATKMNLLYLGIDNPISISVPGVSNEKISATMTNGTLKRSGNQWIAKPSQADKPVEIIVTALQNDKPRVVSRTEFRVRPLPSPSPLIEYRDNNGNLQKYRGGRPFPKSLLLQSEGIKAAIDDGILDIQFKVISFETVFFDSMGNAILERSNGTFFSQRQKDMFKRLSRGKRFYISHVKAVGPDGITQVLNTSMEVIVQ